VRASHDSAVGQAGGGYRAIYRLPRPSMDSPYPPLDPNTSERAPRRAVLSCRVNCRKKNGPMAKADSNGYYLQYGRLVYCAYSNRYTTGPSDDINIATNIKYLLGRICR